MSGGTPLARGLALGLGLVVAVACRDTGERAGRRGPARELPATPVALDLGQEPIVNPLNLWEMMIEGGPDHEIVGTIGTRPVTTGELDVAADRLLTRIGDRIYLARDAGWRALLEQEGLTRAAAAAHRSVDALLAAAFADLPSPPRAELDAIAAGPELAALAPAARADVARTWWRYRRWLVARSLLVDDGLRGVPRQRAQLMLLDPGFAAPETVVATIGDRRITRAELHLAAGYVEQLGRREYVDGARALFEARARDLVLADAARAAGVGPDELVRREVAKLGPPPEEEVARFVAENPAYATERARAVDAVRTLREVEARDAVLARLADAAGGVRFLLREPPIEPIPPRLAAPRIAGAADAPHRIEVLHCLGGPTCAQGTSLVRTIVARVGDRARVELGDYFAPDPVRLRHALALRCADEQGRGWPLLERLAEAPTDGATEALVAAARAAGVAVAPFRACLTSDRHLPRVVESLVRAEQLGLELNVVGIWLDGDRLDNLGDAAYVRGRVDRFLGDDSVQ